ncbi:DNA replication complex GINS protein PSF1, partial [Boeremia exigua]|uniref:DNA replication complex GINS protein PSF1 n=1 Tax=Boeremia exigua TaxID=749465 RepID=UPI001E8E7FD1
VQNAKRTLALPALPPYQPELIRTTTREVRDLDSSIAALLAPYAGSFNPSSSPDTACALLVAHLCMRRNKRCLLAYHKVRVEKLEGFCWEGVDVAETHQKSAGEGGAGVGESSLAPEEEEYVRLYGELLAAYKGRWTDVDLTGSLEPPRDLFIDVRVLRDAGEIQTEYGSITLTRNSQFYVRHGDVERLIQQGYLQRLS